MDPEVDVQEIGRAEGGLRILAPVVIFVEGEVWILEDWQHSDVLDILLDGADACVAVTLCVSGHRNCAILASFLWIGSTCARSLCRWF